VSEAMEERVEGCVDLVVCHVDGDNFEVVVFLRCGGELLGREGLLLTVRWMV